MEPRSPGRGWTPRRPPELTHSGVGGGQAQNREGLGAHCVGALLLCQQQQQLAQGSAGAPGVGEDRSRVLTAASDGRSPGSRDKQKCHRGGGVCAGP